MNIPASYIVNTITPNGIKAYYEYPFVELGLGFITFLKIIINNFYFFRANLGSQQNREEGIEIVYICPAPTQALLPANHTQHSPHLSQSMDVH